MIENTKQRIINVALSLFEMKGFHQVSVREIARGAGLSNGGFYHHFTSKDELLFEINDFIISHVMESGKRAAQYRETPAEKLEAVLRSFINVFDVYKQEVTVMYRENHYLAPIYFEKVSKKREKYRHYMLSIIQEGIDVGEIRSNIPLKVKGMAIFGMINWTYQWYEKNHSLTIDEIGDIYIDFIFNALLSKQAKNNPKYDRYFIPD